MQASNLPAASGAGLNNLPRNGARHQASLPGLCSTGDGLQTSGIPHTVPTCEQGQSCGPSQRIHGILSIGIVVGARCQQRLDAVHVARPGRQVQRGTALQTQRDGAQEWRDMLRVGRAVHRGQAADAAVGRAAFAAHAAVTRLLTAWLGTALRFESRVRPVHPREHPEAQGWPPLQFAP